MLWLCDIRSLKSGLPPLSRLPNPTPVTFGVCRVAGAAARVVAALAQNIQQFADVRQVGHQLPARERRRQAKLSSMVRVVDAAEEGSGSVVRRHCAAGAMQELPKHAVQTTEDVVQFDQGRERVARPMLPIRRGVRCTR